MADDDEQPTPWFRYVLAGALGLSLLSLTYVLFDPDLGTPVPLFQEFTCRGRAHVEIASGFHDPFLRVPATGVYFRAASKDNETFAGWTRLFARDDPSGEWQERLARADDPSEGFVTLPITTEKTQAYIEVRDLAGKICKSKSRIIDARVGPYE